MISPGFKNITSIENIHIFKTNIKTQLDLDMVQLLFTSNRNIVTLSVDLEDIDKVLRIESKAYLSDQYIIDQLKLIGFNCEDLV